MQNLLALAPAVAFGLGACVYLWKPRTSIEGATLALVVAFLAGVSAALMPLELNIPEISSLYSTRAAVARWLFTSAANLLLMMAMPLSLSLLRWLLQRFFA